MKTVIKSPALFMLLTSLLTVSCAQLKIDAPGSSAQTLLVIPVEVVSNVVSVRHGFYYQYEITSANDTSFAHNVDIKLPLPGDMLIVDALPPGDYYVRKFTFLPIGGGDRTYGNNSTPRFDAFSLKRGKITIFSRSLKVTMRNRNPGYAETIVYRFDIVPLGDVQKKAILNTLKSLPNFGAWEAPDS